ncbi:helix-hairpin-helix domain-containing protein [Microbacterium sp.]|uniref:helix-hairpin-helix domain-containing protein n=1 Tax=Microbacterium sp. TaxID=51671 RepID=UPI0039E4DC0B
MTASAASARRRLGVGAAIVLVLAAAAVSVVVGMLRAPAGTEEVPLATGSAQLPAIYVHVSGAVANPGLYRLDDGARVVDVIAAAGGLAADADEAGVNLARPLSDGEQLSVPRIGEAAQPGASTSDGLVNLNTADAATLDTLPRIGPALAQRIIDWREANGRFTSVEDLLAVSGIGEKMLAGLCDLVTV